MLMTGDAYRESLRALSPRVFVNGQRIQSIADEPLLAPGVNGIAHGYDMAHDARYTHLMTAVEENSGKTVNRMVHLDRTPQDLIEKLEATRLLCREVGCAMRYLSHDVLCAVWQATARMDTDKGSDYHARFQAYLSHVQDNDLTVGVAMTDGKGDRSARP